MDHGGEGGAAMRVIAHCRMCVEGGYFAAHVVMKCGLQRDIYGSGASLGVT